MFVKIPLTSILLYFRALNLVCFVVVKRFVVFCSNFNMDDFKRFYSNNDEDKSVPYFWEKFDKENYSIWFGEYK